MRKLKSLIRFLMLLSSLFCADSNSVTSGSSLQSTLYLKSSIAFAPSSIMISYICWDQEKGDAGSSSSFDMSSLLKRKWMLLLGDDSFAPPKLEDTLDEDSRLRRKGEDMGETSTILWNAL